MTVLKNGAKILQQKKVGNNDHVVLAHWEGNVHPFVTWHMNDKGDTFWGHYFKEQRHAEEDYSKRSATR